MASKQLYLHTDKLALYDKLISLLTGVERKGAAMPYTSVNGNMFSFLDKNGMLALRLPPEEKEMFIKKYKTKLCDAHGVVLKEYVIVQEKIFSNTTGLIKYFKKSFDYSRSLKSKTVKKIK